MCPSFVELNAVCLHHANVPHRHARHLSGGRPCAVGEINFQCQLSPSLCGRTRNVPVLRSVYEVFPPYYQRAERIYIQRVAQPAHLRYPASWRRVSVLYFHALRDSQQRNIASQPRVPLRDVPPFGGVRCMRSTETINPRSSASRPYLQHFVGDVVHVFSCHSQHLRTACCS